MKRCVLRTAIPLLTAVFICGCGHAAYEEEAAVEEVHVKMPEKTGKEDVKKEMLEDTEHISVSVLGVNNNSGSFDIRLKVKNKLNRAIKLRSAYCSVNSMILRHDFIKEIEGGTEEYCSYGISTSDMADVFVPEKDVEEITIELHAEEQGRLLFKDVYKVKQNKEARDNNSEVFEKYAYKDYKSVLPMPLRARHWTNMGEGVFATYVICDDKKIKLIVFNTSEADLHLRRVAEGAWTKERRIDLISVEYFGTGVIPSGKAACAVAELDLSGKEDEIRLYLPFLIINDSTGERTYETLYINGE